MAEIRTAINITDGLSPAFKGMSQALGAVLKNFNALNNATSQRIDTSSITRAASALGSLSGAAASGAAAQQQVNAAMSAGMAPASGLIGKIKELGAAYLGYMGISSAMGFVKEALDLSDTQRNVEVQLQSVLANVGQTMATFDELKAYAGEIQGKGIYGDEAMIAGAAEFATYMSDKDAIKKMMGTLSNYAMGMTGGGAVDSKQMTQFATQLGMAINGNMAGLSRKGFSMTDAQKEIMKNGTDMQKALVLEEIIGESWDGLYEKMSNTPQGKIIQLQNAIGDMKEVAGDTFYGALAGFADAFMADLPKVENVIKGLTKGLSYFLVGLATGARIALWFANVIIDGWGFIAPLLTAIGAAWLYNAAAEMASAAAAAFAAAQQWVLNSALLACPITWVVAGLYLLVAAFNYLTGESVSATGIITGLFSALGAHLYNIVAFVANAFAGLCEFLNNVFISPLDAIHNLFVTIWNGVISVVGQAVAEVMRLVAKIPGLGKLGDVSISSMMLQRKDIAGGVDNSSMRMDYKSVGLAGREGYLWGAGLGSGLKIDPVSMASAMASPKAKDPAAGETAKNTGKMADKMDASNEDIKLLREIAQRDVINRFTTAEIKVDMVNNNTVNNSMDLDGMASAFGSLLQEQMSVAAEGTHF